MDKKNERGFSRFVIILLEVVYLVNSSFCMPVINLNNSQISGRTTEFNGYEVNEYLGIRYAQPPVGELRFQKTQKLRNAPSQFKAVNVPPACLQYSESPYPWYVNGSHKSEDCLFLNIWTPADASTQNQKAVMYWIYGGGFRYGSIQDPLYNSVALAALGDIIVVTVNYRVGAFGFLTTDTAEAPGNAGLWDILEGLKWVNENIGYFGGDTSRITIAGESAGSFAVGCLSISPLSGHLFSQMIMESFSPSVPLLETKFLNLALTVEIAIKVGCANSSLSLVDQSIIECLKSVNGKDLAKAESEILSFSTLRFFPQYGDEFLPQSPLEAVKSGRFRCKKLLIGNNLNEGTIYVSTRAPEIFGFFGEKVTQSNIQNGIFGNILQKAYVSSLQVLSALIGDLALVCPDEYYAQKCAQMGGDVYFYFFTHRPSTTPWAPWMGVAHFEEVQFVFGKPLLHPDLYQAQEIKLSAYMIKAWTNFVKTGEPNRNWPLYSKEYPVYRNFGETNSTKEYGLIPHQPFCDLYRLIISI